jgi:hypothetical protein
MKRKALVIIGLVFGTAIGYSMHTTAPEPPSVTDIHTNSVEERLCWHVDHGGSTYAVIIKFQIPDGKETPSLVQGHS